ncbi:Adaptive-response sensory-kinase SasA, partial [Bienertia sinuspersici]
SLDRVVGFGGGMKPADLRGQRPCREELEAELNSTKKPNQILEDRMGAIQDEETNLRVVYDDEVLPQVLPRVSRLSYAVSLCLSFCSLIMSRP